MGIPPKLEKTSSHGDVLLLFLMILLPPAFAGIAYYATEEPLLTALVAVLSFVLSMTLQLIADALGIVKESLARRLGKALLETITGDARLYRQAYLDFVAEDTQIFDMKGLKTQGEYTLRLDTIFVELSLDPEQAQKAQTSVIPERLRTGTHTIWDYLEKQELRHLVIIGAPGSGKTTTLRYVARQLATGQRKHGMPILLLLRHHAKTILDNPNLSLARAIRHSLRRSGPSRKAPERWLEICLEKGGCIVMLDGLDEVADPKDRRAVVDWVDCQIIKHGRRNRFVLTSRPLGYRDNPSSRVSVTLCVHQFNGAQIRAFVNNWYLAEEKRRADDELSPSLVERMAREGAGDLLDRIRKSPALSALSVNPLLLTMMTNIHRNRSTLPGRRVELYEEVFAVCLGRRRAAGGLEGQLTEAQKQRVLQPLAYHMMCQKTTVIQLADAQSVIREPLALVSPDNVAEEFLKEIEGDSGLLVERQPQEYEFAHKTFQEHLAAVHVREEHLGNDLARWVGDPWWDETIRLYCARNDASAIIEACLASYLPEVPALALAMDCEEEALEVQPQARAHLRQVVAQGIEAEDEARRWAIANACLRRRLRQMVYVDERTFIDPRPLTHAEYQIFLDEQRRLDKFYQPDHWSAHRFPAGHGQLPIVGVRPSDAEAFCRWLTEREQADRPGWRYRLPWLDECERHPMDAAEQAACWAVDSKGAHVCTGRPVVWVRGELIKQYLVNDLDLALTLVRNRDLVHDDDLAPAFAHAHARGLTRALDLTPDRALSLDLDQALALILSLDLDLVRAGTRARDLALVHGLVSEENHGGDLYLAFALDLARALTLDLALDLTRDRDLDRDLDGDLSRALARARTNARTLAGVLDHNLVLIRNLAHNLARDRDLDIAHVVCSLILALAAASPELDIVDVLERHADLYGMLVILAERQKCRLPAWEGIRLVRERMEQ